MIQMIALFCKSKMQRYFQYGFEKKYFLLNSLEKISVFISTHEIGTV